jgi:Fur family peroxide stress response transcriptional regulator
MITNMESIKNTLQEKGIKPTYVRLKILAYLERNRFHPTAETIFKALEKKVPTLSRTSVYNNLNIFKEKGLLNPLFINGTEAHFDRNATPHHHFFCKKCKKIIDLDIECSYFKEGDVEGHKITELHGYFEGICKDCLKKRGK